MQIEMRSGGRVHWLTWLLLAGVIAMLIVNVGGMWQCKLALDYVVQNATTTAPHVCEVCDYLRRGGIISPSGKLIGVGK